MEQNERQMGIHHLHTLRLELQEHQFQNILKLIKNTPNDTKLGSIIRKLYSNTSK